MTPKRGMITRTEEEVEASQRAWDRHRNLQMPVTRGELLDVLSTLENTPFAPLAARALRAKWGLT